MKKRGNSMSIQHADVSAITIESRNANDEYVIAPGIKIVPCCTPEQDATPDEPVTPLDEWTWAIESDDGACLIETKGMHWWIDFGLNSSMSPEEALSHYNALVDQVNAFKSRQRRKANGEPMLDDDIIGEDTPWYRVYDNPYGRTV